MNSPNRSPAQSQRVYFQLQTATTALRGLADELFQAAGGITTAQAAALSVIVRDPGCSQRTVASLLRQRESAITAMANRLAAAGLVERRASRTDARAWELWPTQAGKDAMTQLGTARTELNTLIETAVGSDQIENFAAALTRLVSAMDNTEFD
ncbi:MarR family winged helix-turn-helix transcriptional regulator [Nocardia huaxiensis]|uniref:MarR family winged helix-turn-helix transcriptional regulator n=1 Tax=Nocardia huaxiensis TaxID=2755382 RepID=UPI001E3671CB|nr:MarR family winged helix-turn-helix transcriptional regulator [Nocardia huaxiensis]UFS98506.1 MarR family winged helix-turn-helix transcriptional regulator [Nocardia huaxiensis]